MKLFGATWLTGTVIWYLFCESADYAARRDHGTSDHGVGLILDGGGAMLFLLFVFSARELARNSLGLRLVYAATGTALSFIAMVALSLFMPLWNAPLMP